MIAEEEMMDDEYQDDMDLLLNEENADDEILQSDIQTEVEREEDDVVPETQTNQALAKGKPTTQDISSQTSNSSGITASFH